MIDQTSFAKFELSGPGVAAFLQSLADNDVDREVGTLHLHPALQRDAAASRPT